MRTSRFTLAVPLVIAAAAAARAEEVITAEELARLPVGGYADAVALQSGVVDFAKDLELQLSSTEESRNGSTLIVRGGRPGHVGYFVDGELEQDPLTGMPAAAVVPAAISRHKLALDLDYRLAAGEGPRWGPIRPFAGAGVNVLFAAGSGLPYTPTAVFNEVTLANVASEPIGAPNSRRGPWTEQVDLKVDKGFAAGGLSWNAYVWVLNLLDRDNVIDVYASSGAAATTGFLATENGRAFVDRSRLRGSDADVADFYRLRELDPLHFGVPRLVRFGLKGEF